MSLPIEWVTGFIEGEGSFTGTVDKRWDRFAPRVVVYQNNEDILRQVQDFFLQYGLQFKLAFKEQSKSSFRTDVAYIHYLYIAGSQRCIAVYDLIRPHMHHPDKIIQADTWRAKIIVRNRQRVGPLSIP